MKKKLKELFSSVRFWTITLTAIVAVLEIHFPGETLEVLKYWLGAVAGVGTLDSLAKKMSSKK